MLLLQNTFSEAFGSAADLLPNATAALVLFVIFAGAGRLASQAVDRFTDATRRGRGSALMVKRLVRWSFALLGFVLGLQMLGLTRVATSLLATGGFLAVVLGFAFREIGENLLAGLFLGVSRAFEVGDLIESSGHRGTVQDIQLRHVHLRTGEGHDVFVPSASIFSDVLVNFTRDNLRRGDFTIGVDYGTPLPEALDRLLRVVGATPGVLDEPPPMTIVSSFEPQYVELRAFLWVQTNADRGLSKVRSDAMQAGWAALREAGYTVSADVTTSVAMAPLDVRMDRGS